jgi:hypothetical protein
MLNYSRCFSSLYILKKVHNCPIMFLLEYQMINTLLILFIAELKELITTVEFI